MDQPQHSRPEDSFDVSAADREVEGMSINNPGDQTGDSDNGPHGEKKSLMSKMKDKAKDKMHKLKTKLKKDKDSDASEGTEEDTDHFDSDAQTPHQTATSGIAADGSYVNNGKSQDSFGVSPSRSSAYPNVGDEPQQREYDNFLRSTKGEHDGSSHGLTSVPTDYSSPRASVDATMPSSLIEHGSVSDVGEQSSHDLGEIPEKPKEEDKVVATEEPEERRFSNSSFGQFGESVEDTSPPTKQEQEDMDAIERDSMSQELGDESRETKFTKQSSWKETDLSSKSSANSQLPSGEEKADRELPSSTDEAVTSRGSEKGSKFPLRDPDVELPVPQRAELSESMFSSSDAADLRSTADSTGVQEPTYNQGPGVPGVSGRDYDGEGARLSSPSSKDTSTNDQDKVGEEAEPAREVFLDPELDESSLEKQTPEVADKEGNSSPSHYTDEFGQQQEKYAQDAHLDFDDASDEVDRVNKDSEKVSLEDNSEEGKSPVSSVTSVLGSAVGTIGAKIGYLPADDQTENLSETKEGSGEHEKQSQSWAQWASEKTNFSPKHESTVPITPQNSTVENLQSDSSTAPQNWISKAVDLLYGNSGGSSNKEEEDKIEVNGEKNNEALDEVERNSEKMGAKRQEVDDKSPAFVQ
ncbi:hypothetical protein MPTK1_7g07330 [Marchantia polymorpha subsp. ruderalis]|uniref:Uncharacterized protein n=2 Tax=Marchantia polymorpha TaxID=3197 RepID=A0AAF6BX19_MARPO|nr:hypothetical protein MARPO_0076s0061 [Marchantia polymorpha]BBN16553.1 hypothetical protein Mp_7g07330 [Marchantia polymorpha subsp. ruderalis]|eukprot:PTQ34824.1 hypothetical protein MARPO_0076s0061 [Marchantia polymorpha]